MPFHSIQYLIFFPIISILYFLIPRTSQWILLLIASCLFYLSFFPAYIIFPLFLIFLDYFAAIQIEKLKNRQRKLLFILTVILNLLPLLIFKFSAAFSLSLIIPIGLSFYTLQALGYIIDVYKGTQKAEKHLGILSSFILFFPQLLAGPIERANHMIPQFKEGHKYNETRITEGLQLILFGFYKKIVIADNLAIIPNTVFGMPESYMGISIPLAAVVFAFQIYYDFSGYTDIARGSAKVLGFDIINNFNHPYFSSSLQDFWRRWNISLSSWLRDYVYIPLGGNRSGKFRKYINILITFLVSGFWHGSGLTFIIWGAYNGLAIIITELFSQFKTLNRLTSNKIISIPISFIVICIGWVIFRSNSITDIFSIITQFPKSLEPFTNIISIKYLSSQTGQLGMISKKLAIFITASIVLIEFFPCIKIKNSPVVLPKWSIWLICTFAVLAIINLGVIKSIPFIYSQF